MTFMLRDETILPPPIQPPNGVDPGAFTLAYLAAHEAECPACGYNVHCLTEPRCPECGRNLAVKVVTTAAGFSGPWITILITLGISAGIGLLVAAVSLREPIPHEWKWQVVLGYFMGNIPLPLLVILTRKLFVRWIPVGLKILLMLGVLLITLGMLVWFILLIERVV
jgi:hypothetical protein